MSKSYIVDLGHYTTGKVKVQHRNRKPRVLAVVESKELAHTFAESYCYHEHKNAVYGLFGIFVGTSEELEQYARNSDAMHEIFAATATFAEKR